MENFKAVRLQRNVLARRSRLFYSAYHLGLRTWKFKAVFCGGGGVFGGFVAMFGLYFLG